MMPLQQALDIEVSALCRPCSRLTRERAREKGSVTGAGELRELWWPRWVCVERSWLGVERRADGFRHNHPSPLPRSHSIASWLPDPQEPSSNWDFFIERRKERKSAVPVR